MDTDPWEAIFVLLYLFWLFSKVFGILFLSCFILVSDTRGRLFDICVDGSGVDSFGSGTHKIKKEPWRVEAALTPVRLAEDDQGPKSFSGGTRRINEVLKLV